MAKGWFAAMSSKRRILLVDDDPNASYILTVILKLNDFDVIPYTGPEQALGDFGNGLYDLLLLGVKMARMNGFESYQKMKEIDPHAKICFMTNYRQQSLQEFNKLFPELTSDNLVDKPASGNDLMKIFMRSWQMSSDVLCNGKYFRFMIYAIFWCGSGLNLKAYAR